MIGGGFDVGEIGFGAWAIGADWGDVDDEQSLRALHAAADAGVTFFDTADVYGDGRSERLIARFRKERREPIVVATKIGRRAPQNVKEFTRENLSGWIDRSRENLEVDRLDLDRLRDIGVAHNATVVFKGVPVLYSPYLDFSLSGRRKTGLLPPTIGSTGQSGFEYTQPFYWNIAPNMDATLTPKIFTKRGVRTVIGCSHVAVPLGLGTNALL